MDSECKSTNEQVTERRHNERITCNYPALLRLYEMHGRKYEEQGRVINLSRGGAYVFSRFSFQAGDMLALRIGFPTGSLQWGTPTLWTAAVVQRSEPKPDGGIGCAVEFLSFKFL